MKALLHFYLVQFKIELAQSFQYRGRVVPLAHRVAD